MLCTSVCLFLVLFVPAALRPPPRAAPGVRHQVANVFIVGSRNRVHVLNRTHRRIALAIFWQLNKNSERPATVVANCLPRRTLFAGFFRSLGRVIGRTAPLTSRTNNHAKRRG